MIELLKNYESKMNQKYFNLLRFHGPINGTKRILDQITQIDLYDIINGINTAQILDGENFYNNGDISSAVMHYQPVYTDALKKPLLFLRDNYPILGASSLGFIDLGSGRGKALHLAAKTVQQINLIGIDLQQNLVDSCRENLIKSGVPSNKFTIFADNVNNINFEKFTKKFDALIIFNKNSFDLSTTLNTMNKIKEVNRKKHIFYIYNNPVFEDVFANDELIYSMSGWHKNWVTKIFKLKT